MDHALALMAIINPTTLVAFSTSPFITMTSPVRIPYATLRDDPASLKTAIEAGLGSQPGALGVVIIEGESCRLAPSLSLVQRSSDRQLDLSHPCNNPRF